MQKASNAPNQAKAEKIPRKKKMRKRWRKIKSMVAHDRKCRKTIIVEKICPNEQAQAYTDTNTVAASHLFDDDFFPCCFHLVAIER